MREGFYQSKKLGIGYAILKRFLDNRGEVR